MRKTAHLCAKFILTVLTLCFAVGCQDKEAMAELEAMKARAATEAQNKELVQKLFEELDKGNVEIIKELYASDAASFSPSGSTTPISPQESVEMTRLFNNAFPDLAHSLEDLTAAGEKVTVRVIARGTHTGEFLGIPPTGDKIKLSFISMFRVENGRIVEEWTDADMLGLFQQLGLGLRPQEEK